MTTFLHIIGALIFIAGVVALVLICMRDKEEVVKPPTVPKDCD